MRGNKLFKNLFMAGLLVFTTTGFVSCGDDDYDEEETQSAYYLPSEMTINDENVKFTYDSNRRLTALNGVMEDATSTYTFTYDSEGRISKYKIAQNYLGSNSSNDSEGNYQFTYSNDSIFKHRLYSDSEKELYMIYVIDGEGYLKTRIDVYDKDTATFEYDNAKNLVKSVASADSYSGVAILDYDQASSVTKDINMAPWLGYDLSYLDEFLFVFSARANNCTKLVRTNGAGYKHENRFDITYNEQKYPEKINWIDLDDLDDPSIFVFKYTEVKK